MVQLLRPVKAVLMDEVTTGLDVVSRSDFLKFMRAECESRGVCCMYATHVFDGTLCMIWQQVALEHPVTALRWQAWTIGRRTSCT